MDSNTRYRRLTSGVTGDLRALAHRMIADPDMLPGRKELKAAIAELIPDDHDDMSPVRAAVEKRLVALAEKAQEDRSERFTLRGMADEFALDLGAKLEARDRYMPTPEPEAVDLAAAVAGAEDYTTIGGREALARDLAGIPDSEQHWGRS